MAEIFANFLHFFINKTYPYFIMKSSFKIDELEFHFNHLLLLNLRLKVQFFQFSLLIKYLPVEKIIDKFKINQTVNFNFLKV